MVIGNYTGHVKCVEAFLKLELNRNISNLDPGLQPGLLGSRSAPHGYELVDGLDASLGRMLGRRGRPACTGTTSWPGEGLLHSHQRRDLRRGDVQQQGSPGPDLHPYMANSDPAGDEARGLLMWSGRDTGQEPEVRSR